MPGAGSALRPLGHAERSSRVAQAIVVGRDLYTLVLGDQDTFVLAPSRFFGDHPSGVRCFGLACMLRLRYRSPS